jgi:hypothetical protein
LNVDERLKLVIGDLAVQLTIAQQKIEELEAKLAERNDGSESGTPASS